MSQKTLDIVRGIAQAAANTFDGALDDKGEPIKIGLKREEGNPMVDSRKMDGFNVRVGGTKLIVSYQSDILLKDVYDGNIENECEKMMGDIVKWLKKEYKKVTGSALTLTKPTECDILVQSTSRVRVFLTATKVYNIGGMDGSEDHSEPSDDRLEDDFKRFLELEA
jgi:hypothetical protein